MITLTNFLKCSGEDCFKNDKFKKNFYKGIVDSVSYRGVSIEQRPEVLSLFFELIKNYNPSIIIEIGTFAGGLTLMINDIIDTLNLQTKIITYDVSKPEFLFNHINHHNVKNIDIKIKNLFDYSYQNFANDESQKEIYDLINNNDKCIILCDGGCKRCEYNLISPLLKHNDIIMAHDYAPNKIYFDKYMYKKIWNWHEIEDSDIEKSMKIFNIEKYMYEKFLSGAWFCSKKL